MKFYTIHRYIKFCWNIYLKVTKLFVSTETAPISQRYERYLFVALKSQFWTACLLVMRGRCGLVGDGQSYTRMLEVTTVGRHSHVGSRARDEVRQRLVDAFLWQLFPGGLQGGFQLISRLRFRLEFMVLFQHGSLDVIVQRIQIWRVWSHSFFAINPLYRQFWGRVLCELRRRLAGIWRGLFWLKQHNFVIFSYI